MDGIGRFFCALVAIKELSLWSMDSINCATALFVDDAVLKISGLISSKQQQNVSLIVRLHQR